MNAYFKKVLLTSFFVLSASGVLAAPTVRTLSAENTVPATTDMNTSSVRAGSLRSTGGYVRPVSATSKSVTASGNSTDAGQTASGSSVSSGTIGLNRTASSPQRLSIGKYIGAPRSISTEATAVNNLADRVDALEATTERLDADKQDKLGSTEFITVENDDVILEFAHLKEALSLHDGREVELDTTDDGVVWRYVGDNEWDTLLTWDDLKSNLDIADINTSVTNMDTKIGDVVDRIARLEQKMTQKLDIDQGEDNAGKFLVVGTGGEITTGEFDLDSKVNVTQGEEKAGKVLLVGADGDVTTSEVKFADKVDVVQGQENAGKVLIVGQNGSVSPGEIDLAGKVDVDQGTDNAGKVLMVDERGEVIPGVIDLSGKVDVNQGENKAGKALIVGADGMVTTGSINTHSLGLGYLAYKDQVKNEDVANDAAIERKKMAADITDTLYWVDHWRNVEPEASAARYVMAIDEYGERAWFRVVTGEEE
ncbi:MAG: hypothetical protein J6Y07_03480 [Alphaproteobacteria bacterium]|nr:hypothetical protein [Alphaproteobacteria bacterium]